MFVTALIWGAGVSLGACVGLLTYSVCRIVLDYLSGEFATTEIIKRCHLASIKELRCRNSLLETELEYLASIADAADAWHDARCDDGDLPRKAR